jgi:hypothetical protein
MPVAGAADAVRRGRRGHRHQSGSQGALTTTPRPHPEEASRLLIQFPLFWWDHVLCPLGTGLRFGELAGLRRRRVHLDRPLPVLQVIDTRYQAGRFGRGFKPRPKSDAGSDPSSLVFTGPGGGPGRPGGRVAEGCPYRAVAPQLPPRLPCRVGQAGRPHWRAAADRRRVLKALRAGGPQTIDQLTAALAKQGRARPARGLAAAGVTLPCERAQGGGGDLRRRAKSGW